MPVGAEDSSKARSDQLGSGCAYSTLAVNTLLIGLLASSFSQGPYSSREQEVWYRYGSIGILLAGVVIPGLVLLFGGKRSPIASITLTGWMLLTLVAALFYAMASSGGV